MKSYRLKIDLNVGDVRIPAGTIVAQTETGNYICWATEGDLNRFSLRAEFVENRPEYFEEA